MVLTNWDCSTDLPLFGSLRRNLFSEAVKQAEEMGASCASIPARSYGELYQRTFPNAGAAAAQFSKFGDTNGFFYGARPGG